jgi:hypothetical protein
MVHLASPGAPLGPLTARLRAWPRLTPGAAIELEARAARVWSWTAPAPAAPSRVAAAIAAARAVLPPPALDGELLAAADLRATKGLAAGAPRLLERPPAPAPASTGLAAVARQPRGRAAAPAPTWTGLAAAARRLAGVGPGLTPAGDDVLAGLLLAERFKGSDPAGAWRAVAPALPATTSIGRVYLRAAARGECAQPVARVLDAALRGDAEAAARRAPALAGWGATTGPALLAGVAAGFRHSGERR